MWILHCEFTIQLTAAWLMQLDYHSSISSLVWWTWNDERSPGGRGLNEALRWGCSLKMKLMSMKGRTGGERMGLRMGLMNRSSLEMCFIKQNPVLLANLQFFFEINPRLISNELLRCARFYMRSAWNFASKFYGSWINVRRWKVILFNSALPHFSSEVL